MKKKKYSPESKKEILRQRSKENRRKAKEQKSAASDRLDLLERENMQLRKEHWLKETELEYLNMIMTSEALFMQTIGGQAPVGAALLTQGIMGGNDLNAHAQPTMSTQHPSRTSAIQNSHTTRAVPNMANTTMTSTNIVTNTTTSRQPSTGISATTTTNTTAPVQKAAPARTSSTKTSTSTTAKTPQKTVKDKRVLNSQKQSKQKQQQKDTLPSEKSPRHKKTSTSQNATPSTVPPSMSHQQHDMQQRFLQEQQQIKQMQSRAQQQQQQPNSGLSQHTPQYSSVPSQHAFNPYPPQQQQSLGISQQYVPSPSPSSRLETPLNTRQLGADESKSQFLMVDGVMEKTQDSFDHSQEFAFGADDSNFKFDQSSVDRSSMGHLIAAFQHQQQEATEDSMSFDSWLTRQHVQGIGPVSGGNNTPASSGNTVPYGGRAQTDFSMSNRSSSALETSSTQSKPRPRNFLEALEQEK